MNTLHVLIVVQWPTPIWGCLSSIMGTGRFWDGRGGSVTPSPWHGGFLFPLNLPLALSPGPETGSHQANLICPLLIPLWGTRYKSAEPLSWLTLRPGFTVIFFLCDSVTADLRLTWNLLCSPGCSWPPLLLQPSWRCGVFLAAKLLVWLSPDVSLPFPPCLGQMTNTITELLLLCGNQLPHFIFPI